MSNRKRVIETSGFASIEEAVDAINRAENSAALAAGYAVDAAEDAGYGCGLQEIEAHLDSLTMAGAKFSHPDALCLAIEYRELTPPAKCTGE